MPRAPKPKSTEPAAPNYITPPGYKRLADEMGRLRSVDRPKVVEEVAAAAALGDRSENAEYIYGKKKLREIDRRMGFLTKRLEHAVIVDPRTRKGEQIFFGATVDLEDDDGEEQTVQLVGVDEIDVPRGKISWRSPIGGALLGKREGDEVRVVTPAGTRTFTVAGVRYE